MEMEMGNAALFENDNIRISGKEQYCVTTYQRSCHHVRDFQPQTTEKFWPDIYTRNINAIRCPNSHVFWQSDSFRTAISRHRLPPLTGT